MANTLGYYSPAFYASEALIQLENSLGMGRTVHRGFDEERRAFGKGDVINIKRPASFTVSDIGSAAQNVTTESVQLSLSFAKEVRISIPDTEFAKTGEAIINDHIRPATYALANYVEQQLFALYKDIPNYFDVAGGAGSTAVASDVVNVRKVLANAGVPMDNPAMLSLALNFDTEAALLSSSAFTQWQGSGGTGERAQVAGILGQRFGIGNIWATQNVTSHTKGTINDTALLINNGAGYAAGSTTINLDAADASVTGTLLAGDVLTIAHGGTTGTKNYVVTATSTASGNAFTGVTISPGLAAAVADNAVVTARADDHAAMLAYHRDAFALAFARLPDHKMFQNGLGLQVASIQDPASGVSIRARVAYDNTNSAVQVVLDTLFGVKTLNPYLAARLCG